MGRKRTGWAGRAGRAERVRAPIGGCNIVLLNGGREGREGREGRKGCGRLLAGCNIVLLKWGEGGKGGKSGKSGKGGKGGKGGKSGKGAGTYWRL